MTVPLYVLYQVSNHDSDKDCFNAFSMPREGAGVSLAAVKRHCKALQTINHEGVDGFHWRVRMDDKATNSRDPSYSWWDIQDENARLPTKDNITLSQLQTMLKPTKTKSSSTTINAANKASGAIRSLGKAMNAAVSGASSGGSGVGVGGPDDRGDDMDLHAPRVSVVAFKLLDLTKVQEKFHYGVFSAPAAPAASSRRRSAPNHRSTHAPRVVPRSNGPSSSQPPRAPVPPQQQHQHQQQQRRQPPRQPTTASKPQQQQSQEPSLMDFVSSAPTPTIRPPSNNISTAAAAAPKTRAEKLKEEYERKKRTQNKVWDDIDQRWVEIDPNATNKSKTSTNINTNTTNIHKNNTSEPPPAPTNTTKIKGISIDPTNAIGKSANVQAAVQNRVEELQSAQQKAISELKEREAKVQNEAEEEDLVRLKLEPKLRAWSEEHGKKKQLRALLSSLHLILWEGSGWKQVSLGDILEEKKARRCYLKATLKVHPDKTRELDAEKRFIAKRVFDALSQAMTEFENNK